MTIKKYQGLRIWVVILLSSSIAISINLHNYVWPVIAVTVAMLILYIARQKVDGVLADERDYIMAGQAARYSLTIFAFLMMIGVFSFLALQDKNPVFADLSTIFAYLTCLLMFINFLVFYFLKTKISKDKPGLIASLKHYLPYLILAFFLALIVVVASLRLFSGEDGWICQDGVWVKHGQPRTAMPEGNCR